MACRALVPPDLACCKPNNLPLFTLSTHTHKHTCSPACPATPDDWLFVCVEEFTLHCVWGNWLPVVQPGLSFLITGHPPEVCLVLLVVGGGPEDIFTALFGLLVLSNGGVICDYLGCWRVERGQPHTIRGCRSIDGTHYSCRKQRFTYNVCMLINVNFTVYQSLVFVRKLQFYWIILEGKSLVYFSLSYIE